jgi:hypothetical protein
MQNTATAPSLSDISAALDLIQFLANLGDEAQADNMARKVHPKALASQFVFAVCSTGEQAFITPAAGFEREDNGAFEFWEVLSPVSHILPPDFEDTSGTGFWHTPGYANGSDLAALLLDLGFMWSESAQKFFEVELGVDSALEAIRALVEARAIADGAQAGRTSESIRI